MKILSPWQEYLRFHGCSASLTVLERELSGRHAASVDVGEQGQACKLPWSRVEGKS